MTTESFEPKLTILTRGLPVLAIIGFVAMVCSPGASRPAPQARLDRVESAARSRCGDDAVCRLSVDTAVRLSPELDPPESLAEEPAFPAVGDAAARGDAHVRQAGQAEVEVRPVPAPTPGVGEQHVAGDGEEVAAERGGVRDALLGLDDSDPGARRPFSWPGTTWARPCTPSARTPGRSNCCAPRPAGSPSSSGRRTSTTATRRRRSGTCFGTRVATPRRRIGTGGPAYWRQKDDWSLGLLRPREAQTAAAGDVDRSRREAAEARRILAADGTHPELLALR